MKTNSKTYPYYNSYMLYKSNEVSKMFTQFWNYSPYSSCRMYAIYYNAPISIK